MKVGEEVENDNLKKRGRPKGSKNGFTKAEVEKMQRKIDDLEKQYNSYDEVVSNFVDGFVLEMTKSIKTISLETLQIWFSNPDQYMTEINDLLTYYYIIDGDITIEIIGDLIDEAVDTLNKSAKRNTDIGELFNHEPKELE